MRIRTANLRHGPDVAGHSDSAPAWLIAEKAYDKAIEALHELGRTLEALQETEHARAARLDGDHQSELKHHVVEALRDAQNLTHRANRHLRTLMQKGSANDAD
jgi:hypothetical protein